MEGDKCVRCEIDRKSCNARIAAPPPPVKAAKVSKVPSSDTIFVNPRPVVAKPITSAPAPAPISDIIIPPLPASSITRFSLDPTSPLHRHLLDPNPTMVADPPEAISRKRSGDEDAPSGHSSAKLARTSNSALRSNRGVSSSSSTRLAVGRHPSPAAISPSSSRSGIPFSVFSSRLGGLEALADRHRVDTKIRADQNFLDLKARIDELQGLWEESQHK